MATTMTVKGQVTIPKRVRVALHLEPGDAVEFDVNEAGQVLVRKAAAARQVGPRVGPRDRFEAMRGKAPSNWSTDELMALLRDPD